MWLIRKDGLWQMGHQQGEIREFMPDGRLTDIPTCLWSDRRRDAMAFDDEFLARHIVKLLGAELLVVEGSVRKATAKAKAKAKVKRK